MILAALLSLFVLTATPVVSPSAMIPDTCLVTPPNGVDPEDIEPPDAWVGKDGLYVGVPTDGIYYAKTEPDAYGGWNKHIWVQTKDQGPLTVTIEPVGEHTSMEPGHADMQPGSLVGPIWFPEEGCYEVTGTTPQTTIAVTVWVVFIDDWLDVPPAATPA